MASEPNINRIIHDEDFLRGRAVTASLVSFAGTDEAVLLHQGFFRRGQTLARTRARIERETADWVERSQQGALPWPPRPFTESPATSLPWLTVKLREMRNLLNLAASLLFVSERWKIGVVVAPVADFIARGWADWPIHWVPHAPYGDFYADPFAIEGPDGVLHILFEAYRGRLGYAELVQITMDTDGRFGPVEPFYDFGFHASFPFVMNVNGGWLCIPETQESGKVFALPVMLEGGRLKAGEPFLLLKAAIADPIVFSHGGRWWLMGSDESGHHLHAWHSSDIRGQWTAHTANPIKSCVFSSRPAGPVFHHQGDLIRPAQDGSRTYGGAVTLNRIVTLTPEQFVEETVVRIDPNPNGPCSDGIHSFIPVGDRVLIDGKKFRFNPLALWHRLKLAGN